MYTGYLWDLLVLGYYGQTPLENMPFRFCLHSTGETSGLLSISMANDLDF